jgi:hypothetical protein
LPGADERLVMQDFKDNAQIWVNSPVTSPGQYPVEAFQLKPIRLARHSDGFRRHAAFAAHA